MLCVVYVGGISVAGGFMRQPLLIEIASFFFFVGGVCLLGGRDIGRNGQFN